jgi:hypothetical protein
MPIESLRKYNSIGGPMFRSALIASLLLFSAQSYATCAVEDIAGNYASEIDGGGQNSTTELTVENATLSGVYFMSDSKEQGTLDGLNFDGKVLTGNWTDAFGTGTIEFTFADDCTSFEGWWGVNGGKGGSWNGKKN